MSYNYFSFANPSIPPFVNPLVAMVGNTPQMSTTQPIITSQLKSDAVLSMLRNKLKQLNYNVEDKSAKHYIPIKVSCGGHNHRQYFVDAISYFTPYVQLEVEAGRSIENYQILKDILVAATYTSTRYLVLIVPENYIFNVKGKNHISHPYKKSEEIIYSIKNNTNINLDLDGILLIGY